MEREFLRILCIVRFFSKKNKKKQTNQSKTSSSFVIRIPTTSTQETTTSTSSNWFISVTCFTLLHHYSYNDGRTASRECRSQEEEFEHSLEKSKNITCFRYAIRKIETGMSDPDLFVHSPEPFELGTSGWWVILCFRGKWKWLFNGTFLSNVRMKRHWAR